jgi:hypothetical protein
MPDQHRDQIGQLTAGELDRYASQLARCLKALNTGAPIRAEVQRELAAVRAEQGRRAGHPGSPADPGRQYDTGGLTAGQLERTRRELAASLALSRPDSPARVPILAHMAAIDAAQAAQAAGPDGLPDCPSARPEDGRHAD